jgi:NadR type nicotinamide-nucleotide adenylyltransferase
MGGRKRGLTLGKYAPLHRGHQLVIETALSEMDEVAVVIYDAPETTDVPLGVRAGWIRALYPMVEVIEAWDGPAEVGYTAELMHAHEDYVLNHLDVGRVTHFYSSEPYGEHMSRALGAVDRRVDEARATFPVSGTELRADPFAHRRHVDSRVYRDLITNVVLLGAPSTGKSTLAARLASEFRTVWMPEYGREYWEEHQVDRRLSAGQLVEIAQEHLVREEALLGRANRYLFTDTNAMTTLTFGRYYHGEAHPRLATLAEQAAARYDVWLLCDADIPYDDTWDRSGEVNRREFQCEVVRDLRERGLEYHVISGSIEERVANVRRVLSGFRKYSRALGSVGGERT